MNYFDNVDVANQFEYAKYHLDKCREIVADEDIHLIDRIKNSACEIFRFLAEMIPLLGLIPARIERSLHMKTVNQIITERVNSAKNEIESESYRVQELYFEICSSSKISLPAAISEKLKPLDNSTPDLQLLSLIRDLKQFIESNQSSLSLNERKKLESCLAKLEAMQETAVVISTIMLEPSLQTKETLRRKLMQLCRERIQKLPLGESLLIPCGYMTGNVQDLFGLFEGSVKGHMMVMKVEKKRDGLCDISIFNTGQGKGLHIPDNDNRVYPLVFENVAVDSLIKWEFLSDFTKFTYSLPEKPHRIESIYLCFMKYFGSPCSAPRDQDKSHRDQGGVENCTKKSLQVWLHQELQDEDKLYQDFRIYRLEKQSNRMQEILNRSGSTVSYVHPIARGGNPEGRNPFLNFCYAIYGLFHSRVIFSLSKSALQTIYDLSEQVLIKLR